MACAGMAYADYHPTGDDSADVQVYIFEMGNTLKALGKYAAEKPEELKLLPIGSEGYAAAGSTIFDSGPYYTQVVATERRRQVCRLRPRACPADRREAGAQARGAARPHGRIRR